MGSSESEDRSDRDRPLQGSRASASVSRRASTGSSSRSPLSGPAQAPPLPAPLGTSSLGSSSQRPQQVAVETETVPSVPTVAVVSSAANSSLRIKRSQESVPRVPQTRATKKRSQRLTQGSKADIFAAKVANAVDEQDSSGSDEAFVYDTTQPPQQQPQSSQASQGHHTSAAPSLAGDSFRRPYRRTGSTASVTGTPHPLPNDNNNGYFASLSSQPGYETDDYYMDGEDDGQESYEGQVSPAPHWSSSSQSQPQHQSPRSFVVPKQNLVGRHRLPPSPFMNNAPSLPPQEANVEGFGSYVDPEQLAPKDRYRDPRDLKEPRLGRPYFARHNSRTARHPSRSGLVVEDDAPPLKDPNNSIRAKTSYLQRWRTPAYSHASLNNELPREPDEELDERASLLRGRPSLYNYHTRSTNGRRKLGALGTQGISSQALRLDRDPEMMSQQFSPAEESAFAKFNSRTPLGTKVIVGLVTILICLLSLAFVVGLLVAASQPLKDFNVVSLSDVFVSDKELVYSIILHARNPGIFATTISEGELDIFATSTFLDGDGSAAAAAGKNKPKPRTVLLGTVRSLESPVTFHGGLAGPRGIWKTAPVKLVDPLANNTRQWSDISAHEFDLTVKGFLSYKVLGSEYRETVSNSYHVMMPGFMDGIHSLV